MLNIKPYSGCKSFHISPQGLTQLLDKASKAQFPGQHVLWTDDIRAEIPIRVGSGELSGVKPCTVIEAWQTCLTKFGQHPAHSVKRGGEWVTKTFKEYYDKCINFAKSLIKLEILEFKSINIIGWNAPQWAIAFYGSIFARNTPVGVYSTNSKASCQYIAEHSEAAIVIAENKQKATRYKELLKEGKIKKIVLYMEDPGQHDFGSHLISWQEFMQIGVEVDNDALKRRWELMQPGSCATLLYTSGTTGLPKGVMLSHDNLVWTPKAALAANKKSSSPKRIISYLPLSHVAALGADILAPIENGNHVWFADPTALQGTLMETVKEVKPQIFFGVSRIWEKIYEKMQEAAKNRGGFAAKISAWAKSVGYEGTFCEAKGEATSWQFKLAKIIVYKKIKQVLGLDQCQRFAFGGSPLNPEVRRYFTSLNFFLTNGYGMTQSCGPQNFTSADTLVLEKPQDYNEVGVPIPGTELIIDKNKPEDEDGEICFRGRNTFMGYFKNPEETSKAIDEQGFLHSGDLGKTTETGVLFITGRIKELIITSGGQNIPPILIQNEIKNALPCLSNAMVVGDNRKFHTCILTLKEAPPKSGQLDPSAVDFFKKHDIQIVTIQDAIQSQAARQVLKQGLVKSNQKAISNAQKVQDFLLLAEDFTPENGTLTPTLKMRRKQILKQNAEAIDKMYSNLMK